MGTVRIITDGPASLDALESVVEWAEEVHLAYAWASARGPWTAHWQTVVRAPIVRAVLGLHFDRTDPACLRALIESGVPLRVRNEMRGVFHPKVIVGVRDGQARALIGSSNLTGGGFHENEEANVLIQCGVAEEPGRALLDAIGQWWSGGQSVTEGFLAEYEQRFFDRERMERSWRAVRGVPEPGDELPVNLDRSWPEYYAELKRREVLPLAAGGERLALEEIERFHEPLSRPVLGEVARQDWILVGDYGANPTGWFGPIRHRAVMALLKNRSKQVSARLSGVPIQGDGPEVLSAARRFLDWALRQPYVSIGSASRLLMARRPDLFLCVNNANRARVTEEFRMQIGPKDAASYLRLHEIIWRLRWHQAPAPSGNLERRVWAARAALLDRLLYWDTDPIPA